jgi:lipopolysaccharide transport system ATP-binding protein
MMESLAEPRVVADPSQHRELALSIAGVGKRYVLKGRHNAPHKGEEFWALRGVSCEIREGERVGIIGRNGAGKSTLLKILSRVVPPSEGRVEIRGRIASLLEVGTGFNPRLSGRENIYLNASLFALSSKDVDERLDDILAFAELGRFIDEPVNHYSTGMRSRLGFAIAAHLDPDILMLDEVLSVGDASFQAKCLRRVGDLTRGERTLLFVSHSVAAVRRFCDRAIWLERGEIVMDGPVIDVTEAYESKMLNVSGVYRAEDVKLAPRRRAAPQETAPLVAAEGPIAKVVCGAVKTIAGEGTNSVRLDEPLVIEIVFDVLQPGCRVEPAFHLLDERENYVFVAAFTDSDTPNGINTIGRYTASATIPGNLLNEGVHRVTLCLSTADPLVRHEVLAKALSFSVYETSEMRGPNVARGGYARGFPGAVRPRLHWTLRQLD